MSTTESVLLEARDQLLQTIEQNSPAGPYLRYDAIYDRIAQARLHENQALPQGVWQRAPLQADWELVESLCAETIARRSKDMQLAVWRVEALIHLHGLRGYIHGCQLVLDLHEQFAVNMHPAPEQPSSGLPLPAGDPGVEHRINVIAWMNDKLSIELKLLPITSPHALSEAKPYSLADLESARLHEQALQKQPGGLAAGESTLKLFEASLAVTSPDWLFELWGLLNDAAQMTAALDQVFDHCYGHANSGLLRLQDALEQMAAAVAPAVPRMEEDWEADVNNHVEIPEIAAQVDPLAIRVPTASRSASSTGEFSVRSREEAYLRLTEIADFLADVEPHSPVPYLLRRAIAWGGMTLQELLPELLQDQAALKDVGQMLRLNGGSASSHLK
jgi:type VI secretion system protein ImpA